MAMELKIRVRVNWARVNSLIHKGTAVIRKTKKGERQAVMHRYARLIRETCVRVGDVRPMPE